jgi:heptosyltransferase-3
MLFNGIKRILLMKLKHIGDVLLSTPCIRALHATFPDARICALVNEECAPILANHPLLDEVIAFPRSSLRGLSLRRVTGEYAFLQEVRRREFDMVVDLTSGDRSAWLAWLSGARYRLAHDPQGRGFLGKALLYNNLVPYPQDPDLHEVQKNLGIIEHFGMAVSSLRLELYPSAEDLRVAEEARVRLRLQEGERCVVVHPTSRWLFKCWADDRFAALIDWVQDHHACPVVVTCGPDPHELERVGKVLAGCTSKPRSLLGELTLMQWAALVRKAQLFVGVDSAPMHIAASQNIPTLAFFGPTGFHNWRPWAVRHIVLVHDCPCSRDRRPHCDWTRTRACMDAITLDEAKQAIDQLMTEN